jgi:hypothetical protein
MGLLGDRMDNCLNSAVLAKRLCLTVSLDGESLHIDGAAGPLGLIQINATTVMSCQVLCLEDRNGDD